MLGFALRLTEENKAEVTEKEEKERMKNKLSALFLIGIVALSGIGISYAGWTDIISVTGTVQTGHVGFEITSYSGTWVWKQKSTHEELTHYGLVASNDINGDGKYNDDPDGFYTDTDYILVAYSYAHNEVTNQEVEFEFVNLFPCIPFKVDFSFTIGTIPVFLTSTNILWTNQKINNLPFIWLPNIAGEDPVFVDVYLTDRDGNTFTPGIEPIQLHPGVTYTWNLVIHIPQCNAYMNSYAEGECYMNIIQWSDQCNGFLPGKTLTLPEDLIQIKFYHPGPVSYWKETVQASYPGGPYNQPLNQPGPFDCIGWCVDQTYTIPNNAIYWCSLYSSYDPDNPCSDPDWPYVNYIINHKGGASADQIQKAIWYFIDGGWAPYNNPGHPDWDPMIQSLIDSAYMNWDGINYQPGTGNYPNDHWIAVIVKVDPQHGNHQCTFIEVDP